MWKAVMQGKKAASRTYLSMTTHDPISIIRYRVSLNGFLSADQGGGRRGGRRALRKTLAGAMRTAFMPMTMRMAFRNPADQPISHAPVVSHFLAPSIRTQSPPSPAPIRMKRSDAGEFARDCSKHGTRRLTDHDKQPVEHDWVDNTAQTDTGRHEPRRRAPSAQEPVAHHGRGGGVQDGA